MITDNLFDKILAQIAPTREERLAQAADRSRVINERLAKQHEAQRVTPELLAKRCTL
jgi:hypothetical protein